MMNVDDEKLEKVINEALELYEKGKPIPEILDFFPEEKEELKKIFRTIEILVKGKDKVLPPEKTLSQVLEKIPSVTKEELTRYFYRGKKETEISAIKGRDYLKKEIEKQYTMIPKWKIIVPLSAFLIVAAVLIVTLSGGKKQETPTTESPTEEVVQPPLATGNIDDVINSLFLDASAEKNQLMKDLNDETVLVSFDSQALNDFAQSYNENDF